MKDDDQLGPRARTLIKEPANDILVSVVSLWELVVKKRVGKLQADINQIIDALEPDEFTLLGITTAHLLTLVDLPAHHRDPFDHLLIAQAISEGATLISEDQHTPLYSATFIPCSE